MIRWIYERWCNLFGRCPIHRIQMESSQRPDVEYYEAMMVCPKCERGEPANG